MRRGRLERDRKNDDDEVDVDDNNIDLVDNRHKINNTVILHATSVSPTGPNGEQAQTGDGSQPGSADRRQTSDAIPMAVHGIVVRTEDGHRRRRGLPEVTTFFECLPPQLLTRHSWSDEEHRRRKGPATAERDGDARTPASHTHQNSKPSTSRYTFYPAKDGKMSETSRAEGHPLRIVYK
ncbi:hypothetical protein V9T40_008770 [Parthenolecanium corni]|uniref:Uncharacterized protein n=1 Tax=Parthenolecanium corni TaxID=536013 RepID=A0AAN9TLH3_9HEMI